MPLVRTQDLLRDCAARKYAVGAFNCNSLDQPKALIAKAEELQAPLIIVEPGVIEPYVDFNDFAMVTARAAKDASVPVSIHLSHGLDIEQFERACKAGFNSVMYDGSKFPFEENVEKTRAAVEIGHKYGAAVEGELGALGSSFVDISETMTDPEKAREFVGKTGVDILAVSIGNSHGFYKGTPHLDFERLAKIREAIADFDCVLTLHGGSGISAEHFARAIEEGMTKICIYTEMCSIARQNAVKWYEDNPKYTGNYDTCEMIKATLAGFQQYEEECIKMFGSAGKASKLPKITHWSQVADPTAVPDNPMPGPDFPSKIALNPNFVSKGKFWDENV